LATTQTSLGEGSLPSRVKSKAPALQKEWMFILPEKFGIFKNYLFYQ